jgi:putative transcriptional regulator
MRRAYDKIAEGLKEAIAIARKEQKAAKIFVPPEIDVRAIRAKLDLSQEDFASAFGFTVHQMRQWEQGRSRPLGAVRAYLMIIDRHPKRILEMLHEVAKANRRVA